MDDLKKDFIKEVEAASGHRFAVEVFADMVRAMAIAIESPLTFGERREQLEAEYEQIRGRYDADEFAHFPRAFAIVCAALEAKREDFLGHALEHLGASNTRNGQFLTPVCVSRFMAACLLHDATYDYTPGKIVKINDPACGSSVLLIEGAEQLHRCGVRGDDILVIAGDIAAAPATSAMCSSRCSATRQSCSTRTRSPESASRPTASRPATSSPQCQ